MSREARSRQRSYSQDLKGKVECCYCSDHLKNPKYTVHVSAASSLTHEGGHPVFLFHRQFNLDLIYTLASMTEA